jgi:hypothetical protein
MKRSVAAATPAKTRWTFVARKAAGSGRPAMKKVAVQDLEHGRGGRTKSGSRARLDSPELAMHLTEAFRSAVRRVKRANGRTPNRA